MQKIKLLFLLSLSLLAFACSNTATKSLKSSSSKTAASESPLKTAAKITGLFVDFLTEANVESYDALNAYIASNDHYFRHTCSFKDVEKMLDKKNYEEAIDFLNGPDCLAYISTPRSHIYLGAANRAKGDVKTANSHTSIAFLLANTIGKTGDGSREKPLRVMSVPAEYDYLKLIVKESRKSQRSSQEGNKELDILTLSSGEELHFDITLHMQMLRKELRLKNN